MTERLYYDDPRRRSFDATIVGISQDGPRLVVRLDRTCFYPTSGGQPYDTGVLGTHRVVDVRDNEAGDIEHVVEVAESSALRVGHVVAGAIDWPRRFDHMQQHSGQHLLSAAFDRLGGARTAGFHLGGETSTIDLAREVSPVEIAEAEDEANRVIWVDQPVAVRYASADEATTLPLRKESDRRGTLRLVEVEGFDLSACGGTHVARTGEVGIVAIQRWERFKGGTRLEFACGGRALVALRRLREIVSFASRLLSVAPAEVQGAIDRLQLELREQRKAEVQLRSELATHQADSLAKGGEETPRGRLVLAAIDGDANALKQLASAVVSRSGHVAVLVSSSRPALVVVARSAELDVSARDVVASLTSSFGGRGGGKADLAQGGGLDADPEAILQEAKRVILG